MSAAEAVAQQPPSIFHVYVDPNFGDNAIASRENPGGTGAGVPAPFAAHPDVGTVFAPTGVVRHAGYAFRTLTRTNGAVAYIDRLTLTLGEGWATFVVIHCLPGLYGPVVANGVSQPIDPNSGQPFNDEIWPVSLPRTASIQGTSALDTIFDARGNASAVLVARASPPTGIAWPITHQDCFVDGVTIRGARSNGQPMTITNATGAGVYIERGQSFLTVSNCFIVDNDVGFAIDTYFSPSYPNRPNLVNVTFARNRIGLWNGSRDPSQSNIGQGVPLIINCVFDDWSPTLPLTDTTPFLGVNGYCLGVRQFTYSGGIVPLVPARAYSAWFAGRDNFAPNNLPANWPVPSIGGTPGPVPPPRVDIGPYVSDPVTTARGTLYLNDVFRASGVGANYSPHDFRLSPFARIGPGVPNQPNPLVNQGICLEANGISAFDMEAVAWLGAPSTTVPYGIVGIVREPFATVHCWDLDAEGYGNARIVNRSGFMVGLISGGNTAIDLGADECDELIMGGFINGTRIFGATPPNAPLVADHKRIFFFGLPNTQNLPRPHHNAIEGKTYDWWPHVQGAPDAAPNTNYTNGVAGSWRQGLVFNGIKPPFMRNLTCDFSPSLLSDPHSQWGAAFTPFGSPDIYAFNPWWQSPAGQTIPWDNCALYDNASVPMTPPHGSQNISQQAFGLAFTPIISGTINPPGTLQSGSRFLHASYPIQVFGAYLPCLDGPIYSTNAWGMGSAGPTCPDWIPVGSAPWRGVRYNCQVRDYVDETFPFRYNLQTFLGVTDVSPAPPIDAALLREFSSPERRSHGQRVLESLRGGSRR